MISLLLAGYDKKMFRVILRAPGFFRDPKPFSSSFPNLSHREKISSQGVLPDDQKISQPYDSCNKLLSFSAKPPYLYNSLSK